MLTIPRLQPVLFCAIAVSASLHAAVVRTPVQSVKPLLLGAIAHGESYGVLVGDAQAFFKEKFGTSAPIEVDVLRISMHRQSGCARLSIRTRQAGVVIPSGMPPNMPQAMEVAWQIDYCDYGGFPQGEDGK
jgi:hypothetical protein